MVALVAVARSRLAGAVVGLLLGVMAVGALRAVPAPLPADHVARLPLPLSATLEGRVVAEPVRSAPDRQRIVMDVRSVDGVPRSGRVQLTLFSRGRALAEGQRLHGEARLRETSGYRNPGGFDYARFLAREDIHVVGSGPAWRVRVLDDARPWHARVRRRALAAVEAALPPTSAALLGGLLLGARGDLPAEVLDAFRRSGVYHVLAVSGFNVALIASAVFALAIAVRASARGAAVAAIAAVMAFAAVVGPEPSVLRAVLMAVLVLGALLLDREASVLNSLALAAIAILAVRPTDLHDPGFQLSFAATAGIVVAPLPRGLVAGAAGVSLAAQLAVLPITLTHFNQVSVIGLLANLAIVPLATVATVVGITAVAVAPLSETIASWLFHAVWPALLAMRAVVRLAAAVPGALLHLPAPPPIAVAAYTAALVLGLLAWRTRESRPRRAMVIAGVAVMLVALACASAAWPMVRPGDGWLRMTVLDVGHGDVAVVETPDRRTFVIHGRPGGGGRFDAGERIVAPFLWNRGVLSLDGVIAAGGRNDETPRLASIRRLFSVREPPPLVPGVDVAPGAAAMPRSPGAVLVSTFGPYGRPKPGDPVVAVRIDYGLASLLLAPGADASVERALVASGIDVRAGALAVGRHGSRNASSPAWLGAVRPTVAIVSVGRRNAQGHPDPDTLARLETIGADVYRTDRDGAVIVETDGRVLDVTTWASGRRARYCLDPEAACAPRRE